MVDDERRLVGIAASYEAKERLVSENTDAQEIKTFLARTVVGTMNSTNRQKTDVVNASLERKQQVNYVVNRPSLIGSWKFSATTADGQEATGKGQFNRDQTFTLSSSLAPATILTARQGRFAYANGVLWMILGERFMIEPLTWINQDQFVLSSQGAEILFDRQVQVPRSIAFLSVIPSVTDAPTPALPSTLAGQSV